MVQENEFQKPLNLTPLASTSLSPPVLGVQNQLLPVSPQSSQGASSSEYDLTQTSLNSTTKLSSLLSSNTPQSEKLEPTKNPDGALSILVVVLGFSALGIYYAQLRKRIAPASFTTTALQAGNDFLLATTALVTGQGISSTSLMLVYGGMKALFLREIMFQAKGSGGVKAQFTGWDRFAAVGCGLAWAALISSKIPMAVNFVRADSLQLIALIAGCTVNTVSSIPLFVTLLKKPNHTNIVHPNHSNLRRWAEPVVPFFLGALAHGLVLFGIPTTSFSRLAQPIWLLANKLIFLTLAGIWSKRRI